MNAVALPSPSRLASPVARAAHRIHPQSPVGTRPDARQSNPGTSPTMELVHACAEARQKAARFESSTLVFLGACALALVGGCAFHLERFVAHWDSFQAFVNTMLH